MAANSPSDSKPAGDDRNLVQVDATTALTFEDKLQIFWKKNRTAVLALIALVFVGIVAKGVWGYMARQKEREIAQAYAVATTTEQLKTFSAAHAGHELAGVAQMRIADEAYKAGKWADAIAAYDQATGILKTGPLAARAKLGRAIVKVQSGNVAEATTELQQIANDANQFKGIRAEAAYHLTTLAVGDGNAADAQKYVDLVNQIEPMGIWSQRASALRATLPATPAPAAPATSSPATEKKEEPGVQLKVPGVGK